uniref:Uncharacterized protein n=1 Tax=Saimiri boliviensis boliviensis TaxID=39432 RepID=A0A2K6V0J2_SAIBB
MELSSMKICAAIPTSRALMPRKRISGLEAGFSLVNTVKAGMIISFASINIYSSVCCYQSEIFKCEFSNSKKSSWILEERREPLHSAGTFFTVLIMSPEKVTSALKNKQTTTTKNNIPLQCLPGSKLLDRFLSLSRSLPCLNSWSSSLPLASQVKKK